VVTFPVYRSARANPLSGGIHDMPHMIKSRVSPKEIEALIERAAKEPGLKDIAALMQLSQEVAQIDRFRTEMSPQPCFLQVAGTAGWLN
jgi:hypothetical protein